MSQIVQTAFQHKHNYVALIVLQISVQGGTGAASSVR